MNIIYFCIITSSLLKIQVQKICFFGKNDEKIRKHEIFKLKVVQILYANRNLGNIAYRLQLVKKIILKLLPVSVR